ncbi:hypothetical protein CPL00172_CDS0078 [Escherichia phage BubbaBully]
MKFYRNPTIHGLIYFIKDGKAMYFPAGSPWTEAEESGLTAQQLQLGIISGVFVEAN